MLQTTRKQYAREHSNQYQSHTQQARLGREKPSMVSFRQRRRYRWHPFILRAESLIGCVVHCLHQLYLSKGLSWIMRHTLSPHSLSDNAASSRLCGSGQQVASLQREAISIRTHSLCWKTGTQDALSCLQSKQLLGFLCRMRRFRFH